MTSNTSRGLLVYVDWIITDMKHSTIELVIELPFTPEFGVRFPYSTVWKKQQMFIPHPRVKVSIVGSFRDREVACSASDRQGSNFKSCVWRTVSSQSSHPPQEALLDQFSLYVHKGGLKPDLFHLLKHISSIFCYLGGDFYFD